MDYKSTTEFLEIIYNYSHQINLSNQYKKKIHTIEQNIKEIFDQRNRDIQKHEMEEDEAEKLSIPLSNSKNPTRNKLVLNNIEQENKKKIDRKEMINYFLKNNNKNKLETIYELPKLDLEINNPKNLQKEKQKNKLNLPILDFFENKEFPLFNKNNRANSNYDQNTNSIKSTCHSRQLSGVRSEKDSYVSSVNNTDFGTSNLKKNLIFLFCLLVKRNLQSRSLDLTNSSLNSKQVSTGLEIIKNTLDNSQRFKKLDKKSYNTLYSNLDKIIESPQALKIISNLVFYFN